MSYVCKLTGRVSDLDHKGRKLKGVRLHKLIQERVIEKKTLLTDYDGNVFTRTHTRRETERELPIHPEVWEEFRSGVRTLLPNQRLEPSQM